MSPPSPQVSPLLAGLLTICGCAAQPALKPVVASSPAPLPEPKVEKMREPLEVTPLELFFSGLRGVSKSRESVSVKNTDTAAVQIMDLRIVGRNPNTFRILDGPMLPAVLQPGTAFTFSVGFEPLSDAVPGVHHARVRIVRSQDDDGPPCDLSALVTRGKLPGDEPPLQQILEALGYAVDVGSPDLYLAKPGSPAADNRTGDERAGDEIAAPLFVRAKPGSVGNYLVARYTADEDSSFGYYVLENKKPVVTMVGATDKGPHQTLNPELKMDSQTSFDPGDATFGLYLKLGRRTLFSEDRLNPGPTKHVARIYPLRSRGRTLVQDAYVVAFDEDGDGDFQDHVFMLWNVKPAL